MFKIKQRSRLDKKYNVIYHEELIDNEIVYFEENTYDWKNNLTFKRTNHGEYFYDLINYSIKYFPYSVIKYITIDFKVDKIADN